MSTRQPPDRRLQEFSRLREYYRQGRVPWTLTDQGVGHLTRCKAEGALDEEATPAAFSSTLRARFAEELKYEAANGLADRRPHESARHVFDRRAKAAAIGAALAAAAAIAAPSAAVTAFVLIMSAYFVAVAMVRISLAIIADIGSREHPRSKLADEALPVVTILAPLFREAHALPGLMRAIDQLNYPKSKLDVKLLLEEHDAETLEEAERLGIAERCDLIVIPLSSPQTKPKACNYGLQCAMGDLIVIYDAEDEPERDQLRAAAEIFAAGDASLACVQARLNFYNVDENWLTRLFTLEYCLWFDHFLPALDRLQAPIPLGGTSNVFRTDILAEVGGWDPYNVTEDADLGLRLARRGYRTAVIASTTYEEANCRTGNWMRQRSRWMKGFMQTWLVHRRGTRKALDWREMISVDFFIGGTAVAALINPLLWLIFIAEIVTGAPLAAGIPDSVRTFDLAALAFGNLSFLVLSAVAPLRRGLGGITPAALLAPIYWMMMSIAAWRALLQLARRPSFWEKTEHGLSGEAKTRRAVALGEFGLEPADAPRQLEGVDGGAERHRSARDEAPDA